MLAALRRFLASWNAPPPVPHRDLAREAAAAEPPTTLTVAVYAGYLPHGGKDEIVVRLRHDGGLLERVRSRNDVVERCARALTAEESRQLTEQFERHDLWNLADQHGPLRDGLLCGVAVATGERLHHVWLSGGGRSNTVYEHVLHALRDLAPVASDAPRRRPSRGS